MSANQIFDAILSLPADQRQELFTKLRANPELWSELHATPTHDYPTDVHYFIVFDGGSLGNPGKGYGSYALIRCDTGQQRIERVEFSGKMTNNEAEYRSLLSALEDLLRTIHQHGRKPSEYQLEIRGDSRLVINQINGHWKVRKDTLQTLCDQGQSLLSQFGGHRLIHHRREHSVDVLGH